MIIQLNDWLYQGDWASVHKGEYRQHRVGAILRVSRILAPGKSPALFPEENCNYLWCPFGDRGEDLTRRQLEAMTNFAWCFSPGGLLIHCQSGQNRSSIVCALVLCTVDSMAEESACSLILEKNSLANVTRELVDKVNVLVGKDLKMLLD